MDIPEIQRSFTLTKSFSGEKIAKALEDISHCYGEHIQKLESDIDGKRTYNIGILKDNKHPQTGLIVGEVDNIIGLAPLDLGTGITFDKTYNKGDKIMVANHRWDDQTYHEYDEERVIKAVNSLSDGLEVALL